MNAYLLISPDFHTKKEVAPYRTNVGFWYMYTVGSCLVNTPTWSIINRHFGSIFNITRDFVDSIAWQMPMRVNL